MSRWPSYKVSDLEERKIILVQDGNHGEYRPRENEFVEDGVAFIRAADIEGNSIRFDSSSKINDTALKRIRKGIGHDLDTLLSSKGTVGKIAFAPAGCPAFVCSPQITFWRSLNHKALDPLFIYYELQSPHFLNQMKARKGETDMADYLSLTSQRELQIQLPPLEDQKRISSVLGAFDKKIALNRQINQTLEQMAQAIFKSWFVDFDPVKAKAQGGDSETIAQQLGLSREILDLFPSEFEDSELGPVPKEWRVSPLTEIAEYLNGVASQKYPAIGDDPGLPVIKIAEMKNGISDKSGRASSTIGKEYIVNDGDVLFSWSGSLFVKLWHEGPGVLNQHLFKATSRQYPKWFYYFWTIKHLPQFQQIAESKATTMGHIQRKHLDDALVLVPSNELLTNANKVFQPLLNAAVGRLVENRSLADCRDSLLPKLISGEISVSEQGEIDVQE